MKIVSNILILFGFNILYFTMSSVAGNAPNPYSIGGIRILMTEKQVLNILGKPPNRSTGQLGCANRLIQLNYPQGEIILEEDVRKNNFYVITVEIKTRRWATEKGIKVGDSISKAKKLYIFKDTKVYGDEWRVREKINRPGILRFKTNSQQKIISIDLQSSYDYC